MSDLHDITIFKNVNGQWWWYDNEAGKVTLADGTRVQSAFPTYGPFAIEAQAVKDSEFFFRSLESRSCE